MIKQTALSWLYLLGAAVCEMAWTYSLKYMRLDELKSLRWATFYKPDGGLPALIPWLGYVFFGLANTALLGMALRNIPTATAFSVWMATTLVFIKVADIFWQKMTWSLTELLFILLITIGVVGLRLVDSSE